MLMKAGKQTDPTIRFLKRSFVSLLIFSVAIFNILGIYTNQKSNDAIYDIGEVYMSGLNDQMTVHFENVIKLRFEQVKGVVSVVPANSNMNKEKTYEELVYRTKVRNFEYLALCSSTGEFQTLYGKDIKPLNPGPFVEALLSGQQRVALGVDSDGNEVVLFGVDAHYFMDSSERCTGLVAAVPLDYITDFFLTDNEELLTYFHIVRPDGSFVIKNDNNELDDLFKQIYNQLNSAKKQTTDKTIQQLSDAIKNEKEIDITYNYNGENKQIHGISLPYSEWYLISVMPYNMLDDTINAMSKQQYIMTLTSCAIILIVIIFIFRRYFNMTRLQLFELQKTQELALEASKSKSEFLANMSHDIRTPMNAIVGMTTIALSHIDDQQQVQNCLKKIALSSKHLLGLINDVLDMSKIESGKLTLSTEQISLKEIFEGIVNIMQPQVKIKKQSFEIHIENIIVENVWSDGVRLNQILLNLLSNATKYTPENGSIQLSLYQDKSPKGEDYVRTYIKIKDNGIGMTPEFLKKIYDSYSRADGERVSKTQGTGLGMAITKYIVDAMEGTIDIQSALNEGTEVFLTFDLERVNEVEMDMVLPPWNMLIVDDDELLCKTAKETLQSIGIDAQWTLSGEKAIELVNQHHQIRDDYQIILLDWKLPGMDGIQVAREIRQILGGEAPILLISAYDWSDFETEAREAGVNGFISKPLFKSTLYHALSQYMFSETKQNETINQDVDLSGYRVLVAEDNELNWEIADELLSDVGMELEWAEDGQICLDKFTQSPKGYYDAILMDIRMPHMTGYEATKAIRGSTHPDALSIPIIAMSADAFSDDIKQCLDCGMNAHVAKPIDVVELTRLLKRYLM